MSVASEETINLAGKIYSVAELLRELDDYVRLEAAEQCFALTALINDPSALVRSAVARKKVGHEILVKDVEWQVRATVAKYCNDVKFLDILALDSHEFVRFVVVKRGHALELLAQDVDEEIAAIARYALQRQVILAEQPMQ
ncbi:MAG: hypothetical protein ABL903_03025 [Methylococcales bacterium]